MADTNKIFKSLQQHSETPPPGLYAKLWKKIKVLPPIGKALLNTILANANTDKKPVTTETEKTFAALQSYIDKENVPPPFDFQKIKEALYYAKPINNTLRKANKRPLLYRAAATAAIVTGIVLLYVNTESHQEEIATSSTKQQTQVDTVKKEQVAVIENNTTTSKKKDIKVNPQNKNIAGHQQRKQLSFNTNNIVSNTNILNNDFLFTFTNFTTTEANGFLSSLKKEKKVTLNKYTYVNVSDKMASFLKQSYAVNRRNKYTWKARRMRKKMDRWKKADELYFDNETPRDPLDIIELSEFLLKNNQ
ncbi:MAG: hypothetical protein JNM14_13355 [Ferruginibacter sp.]|nr:hypothetical protein [Ferruginibacter sp.]